MGDVDITCNGNSNISFLYLVNECNNKDNDKFITSLLPADVDLKVNINKKDDNWNVMKYHNIEELF